jgi:hypothetical protein
MTAGCVAQRPIDKGIVQVALEPQQDQVTLSAQAHKAVDQIVPVDIALANGTEESWIVHVDQVYGVNEYGQRIAAVPLSEAMSLAGDADKLRDALKGGAEAAGVGAVIGAAAGAAFGAAIGAIAGSPGLGAAYGTAIGGGLGAVQGGAYGAQSMVADHIAKANQELLSLALSDHALMPKFTANGYVFLPSGFNYKSVGMVLTNPSGEAKTLEVPYFQEQR